MHKLKEHDLQRDRILAFFIVSTMVLLLILVITSILQINVFKCANGQSLVSTEGTYELPTKMGSLVDFEYYCREKMDRTAFLYFTGASLTKTTKKLNIKAFRSIGLKPRHLIDVSSVPQNLALTIQGETVAFPVGIAPTAYHKWAHPDGESGTAKAAEKLSVVYIASIHSNTPIEEIRNAAPNAILWQQTYIFADPILTKEFLHRAERANYSAIVLTIDKATDGVSWNKKRGLTPWPPGLRVANFADSKKSEYHQNVTWEDVREFIQSTKLPVILKGVVSAEDARMAVDVGAKGVIVSNHGGRALDSLPATIDLVDEVVQEIQGRIDVYLDGGVRTGTDVFKALAKGAKMVFLGRPVVFALGYKGEGGVVEMFDIIKNEFINAMQLSGTPGLKNITSERISKQRLDISKELSLF